MNQISAMLWVLSAPIVVWVVLHIYLKWRLKRTLKAVEGIAQRWARKTTDPGIKTHMQKLEESARAAQKELDDDE